MSGRDQSDAIWIRQQEQKAEQQRQRTSSAFTSAGTRHTSIDLGTSPRFSFARSLSVNSEGASTYSSGSGSPPYSPLDMASNSKSPFGGRLGVGVSVPKAIPGASPGGRFRTSSFSSGYGPSYGQDREGSFEPDPYLIHSPVSTSAPGREALFRRSNSISVGALEHSHSKGPGKGANLGAIDEINKVATFGDAFKRSMGQLFSAPKMTPTVQAKSPPGLGGMSAKKQGQMKDRVVSMLCESAIR